MTPTPTAKTTLSSFKYPRPAPPVNPSTRSAPGPSASRPAPDSFVSRNGTRVRNGQLTYDHFAFVHAQRPSRQGWVGVQRDQLLSWTWTRRVWLALNDAYLYICPREDSKASHTLYLKQIRQVERVDSRPFCLMVKASSQTWYLLFKDSISLYDWFYDIRIRCPLLHIGLPTDFRHDLHVTYDATAGEITGLPEEWIEILTSWDIGSPNSTDSSSKSPVITSPFTEPATSPLHSPQNSTASVEVARPPTPNNLSLGRHRSASAPTAAPSVIASVDQFRKSPNKFRDVDARDLTGVVRPIHLFPAHRGDNCDIWKADWTGSFGTRKVAIQVIRLPGIISEDEQRTISTIVLREVKVLHQLRHPNVVRTRGYCHDQGPLPALVSTWLPQGNLMDYLEHRRPIVSKGKRIKYISEVAAGLNYLHSFSRRIVHGNMRGTQILLSDSGRACISGFGLNPILQELNPSTGYSIPDSSSFSRWGAPEVIRRGPHRITPASDVFSFARTVVEVMTGKHPFYYLADDAEVVLTVLRGVLPRRAPVFGEDGLWQFLERCWLEDPAQRPSMALALLRMEEIYDWHLGAPIERGQN
ncbi:kinase-like protein [Ramaria rubella]|nr:kinase-like protein [Ramaria rubella]